MRSYRSKSRIAMVSLFLTGWMGLSGCGGTSSSPSETPPATTPPPPAPPPAPTPSNAELTLTGSFVCLDPFCDFADHSLAVTNRGGVGASIIYVRIDNRDGQPILNLGADHFINNLGTDRVEPGETLSFILRSQLGFVVVIGYRDDKGAGGEIMWFPDLPR